MLTQQQAQQRWTHLVREVAGGRRRKVVVVELDAVEVPRDKEAAKLCTNLRQLTDMGKPVCGREELSFLGQHVLVFAPLKTLSTVLPKLLMKEVWLTVATQNIGAPVHWHFPGDPPQHLPRNGLCGWVARAYTATEDPTGDRLAALTQWRSNTQSAGSTSFPVFLASLPPHTPAAVAAELGNLSAGAQQTLQRQFAAERLAGAGSSFGAAHHLLAQGSDRYDPYPFA